MENTVMNTQNNKLVYLVNLEQ